jgi:hypothetical protein
MIPKRTRYFRHAYPLPAALGPGVYSASNRNEYQELIKIIFLGGKARPARKADNLTAIYEPIVKVMWDP